MWHMKTRQKLKKLTVQSAWLSLGAAVIMFCCLHQDLILGDSAFAIRQAERMIDDMWIWDADGDPPTIADFQRLEQLLRDPRNQAAAVGRVLHQTSRMPAGATYLYHWKNRKALGVRPWRYRTAVATIGLTAWHGLQLWAFWFALVVGVSVCAAWAWDWLLQRISELSRAWRGAY